VFDSRNAGARTLTVSGYTLNDGNGGGNYSVTTPTAAGNIIPAALTVSASSDTKSFDGTTASTALPVVSGLQVGDTVSGLAQSFDSQLVGSRTLSLTAGYVITDGNGGANYVLNEQTAAGSILAAPDNFAWTDFAGGAWEDGSNWNQGVAPVSGSDVVLPATTGGITYTSSTTIKTLISASDFTINGGSLVLGTAPGDLSSFSGGASLTQNSGSLQLNGAMLQSDVTVNGGTLGGAGTIAGNVNFNTAILAPGSGALNILGDLTLAPGSVTAIDLLGATPGTGYDVISVTGTANLDGTLNASLGYVPGASVSHVFLSAGGITGSFASSSLPAGFSLVGSATAMDLMSGALTPTTSLPVVQAVALITNSVSLGAVSLETPALYASGSSSTTASSSGTQNGAASMAAAGAPLVVQTGDESDSNPMAANAPASLFNQLIYDASMQEWTDESCLVCR